MAEKVVLAYSGGLDTSVIVPWLHENYDLEVIAVAVDVGQQDDFEQIGKRALQMGAAQFFAVDMKDEFVQDIFTMIQAGAKYEGKYLLGTSIARPVITKALVKVALETGAKYIAHGATGKGNDQVRFELSIKALAPHIQVIAPWREWDIKSRSQEIAYLEERGFDLPFEKTKTYSRDENLFHISHEGGELEYPNLEPNYQNVLKWSNHPQWAPDQPEQISLEFVQGVPVALNGEKLDGVTLLQKLNQLAGKHGVGIIDMVENRLVGIKSRGVYETPAGTVLYFAHEELERVTLDKDSLHLKQSLAGEFANLTYNGKWYTRARKALSALVSTTQEYVTGTVHLKLYKGNIVLAGTESDYSLYSTDYSTFEEDEVYNQKDAAGFITCYGLGMAIEASMRGSFFKDQN